MLIDSVERMYLLFVDESGTAPSASRVDQEPRFTLGGVVIHEATWHLIRDELKALKVKYRVDGEVKWRHFAPVRLGSKPHALTHLPRSDVENLRTDLLSIVSQHPTNCVIAAVADTAAVYRRPSIIDADDLYHYTFKSLSERFRYFLQDVERSSRSPAKGMIVADNRNSDQDHRLKKFHQSLLDGSRNRSTYANLVEGLFIAASHHSPGTQLADLVAGAIHRAACRDDWRFYDQIQTRIRRGPTGRVDGYGIVTVR